MLLAVGVSAFAPVVARVFGNPAIAALIPVLGVGMVAGAAAALVTALLRRDLNMKAIARRTLLANAVSGAIATPFVLSGFGAWGLVIQSVGGAILTLVLTVLLVGWPVKFTFDIRVAREMLRFGAPVTGADLLTYYNRESPKLFVGLFLGVEALGIFAMAMRVMNLMLEVVGVTLTKVTLPVMSQVNRTSPERTKEIYLRLIRMVTSLILPAFLLMFLLRNEIVDLILGPNWAEVAVIFSFLCWAGLLTVFNFVNGAALVSIGYPEWRFWFSLVRALLGTALLSMASGQSLIAVAIALLARSIIVEPLSFLVLGRKLNFNTINTLLSLRYIMFAAIAFAIFSIFTSQLFRQYGVSFGAVAPAGIGLMVYIVMAWVGDHLLRLELSSIISAKLRRNGLEKL
ncbi:hypothetical protein roselon_01352 [Roseibacterium elongatum DSM 19469]|uniref:Polysaccharide biosynthesis protein n=1 Tax=Roseicyclus elongatus DSM 19469 TaxID=1294273 RepID=W8SMG5_9RHOB|nr:hypothetical protein roselon_01352 [Roseibacterium elongatum DSM 19469]